MLAALGAFFAQSVLMQSPIGGILKRIPWAVWKWLIVFGLLLAGYLWHQGKVSALKTERFNAGRASAVTEFNAKANDLMLAALKLRQHAETLQNAANAQIGAAHAKDLADIRERGRALLLRKPPGAQCEHDPAAAGLPAISGTPISEPYAGAVDDRLARVPYAPLVDFAVNHDSCFAALKRWEQWHPAQKAIYDEWVKKSTAATEGK